MKIRFLIIFSVLLISSCTSTVTTTPLPENTAAVSTNTPTVTRTPVTTRTPLPSATNTPLPSATPTPTATLPFPRAEGGIGPISDQVISSEKITDIEPFMVWGEGFYNRAVLSPDRTILALAGSVAVKLVDAKSFETRSRIVTGVDALDLEFSTDGRMLAVGLADGRVQFFDVEDGRLVNEFFDHSSPVENLEFDSDRLVVFQLTQYNNSRIVSIVIWQISTGRVTLTRSYEWERGDTYFEPAVCPDASAVTWMENHRLRIISSQEGLMMWDVPVESLNGQSQFSPDGRFLAVPIGNRLHLYNTADGVPLGAIPAAPYQPFQFTPDSRQIIIFDTEQGQVKLYDILPDSGSSPEYRQTFQGFPSMGDLIYKNMNDNAAVSPSGELIALSKVDRMRQKTGEQNAILLYSMADGSLIKEIPLLTGENGYYRDYINSEGETKTSYLEYFYTYWLDHEQTLITLSGYYMPNAVRLQQWDVATGSRHTELDLPDNFNDFGIVFTPDGKQLLASQWKRGLENVILSFDLASGQASTLVSVPTHPKNLDLPFIVLEFTPDPNYFRASGEFISPGRNQEDWSLYWTFNPKKWNCTPNEETISPPVDFSADGSRMLCGTRSSIDVVEIESGTVLYRLPIKGVWGLNDADFSPEGKYLALSFDLEGVDLYSLETGELKSQFHQFGPLTFSPDGSLLVVSSDVSGTYFYDVASGNLVDQKRTHYCDRVGYAFSPDGRLMASACGGAIIFWGLK